MSEVLGPSKKPIHPYYSRRIYSLLLDQLGAAPSMLEHFIEIQKEYCPEYRFSGRLGFGGKFWNANDAWYVNAYPEDAVDFSENTKWRIKLVNEVLAFYYRQAQDHPEGLPG